MDNQVSDTEQKDTMSMGDFMSLKKSPDTTQQEDIVTYDDFMKQSPDKINIVKPIAEEHKNTFLLDMGLRIAEGINSGIGNFNNLLGFITGLNAFDKYKKTFVKPAQDIQQQVREITQPENLGTKIAYDFAEGLGNLGVTIPIDMMIGGATKILLAGKTLPAVETILSNIPDFALGSGWRGLMQGIEKSETPIEAIPKGIIGAGESVAISTLYASAGTGIKGIANMTGLGMADSFYEAAQEGRLPTKEEMIQGATEGAAYGVVFSIIPLLTEATKIGKEKIALNEYNNEINGHIKTGDLPKAMEIINKIMVDERIRPEVKQAIDIAMTPQRTFKPQTETQKFFENIYQKTVNKFQSLENIVVKAKELGHIIKSGEDAGLSAERYLSVGNQAKNTLEQGTFKVTKEGNVVMTGEGLKPILENYDKTSPEKNIDIRNKDLNDYLIAQRTIKDLQRPKSEFTQENIVTPEQVKTAQETLDRLGKKYGVATPGIGQPTGEGKVIPHLDQTATRLYDYQKRVLNLLVDSGNLSQKQYDDILAKNPNYVPFDRILSTEKTIAGVPVGKKRFTGAKAPIKRIKGSELEIHNPIESMIKNTYKIMDIAARNKVWQDIYSLKDIPDIGIKTIKPNFRPIKVKEGETIFRPSQFKPKGNIVEGYVDGKRKYMEVPKNIHDAMTGLNEVSSNILVKILSKPAQWLRTGATTTPEFILRNPIRDQWTALIQTNLGWKPFIDTGSAIADIIGQNQTYNDWIRSGGSYAGFVELSRPRLQLMLNELKGNKSILSNLNIITKLGDLSQLMEQATRVGVFKAGIEKGLSAVEASKQSRESTVDFARRGSMTKDLNATIAFFNAGIQAFDKNIRTMRDDPVGATLKVLSSVTLPSLVFYLINRNDPEYAELPRWQKDLFWMLKVNDIWFRIPKPFTYGQIFGSLPERFFEFVDKRNTDAFNKYGESLYNALSPVSGDPISGLFPTAVRPLVENLVNYSFFRGRAIISESKKSLIPSEQYSRYDTETTKLIGKIFNVPPSKVENLVQGWFGGMGRYGLQTTDIGIKFIRELQGEQPEPQKPVELADIPLVKGFVSRDITSGQAESIQIFYDNRDKISRFYLTYNKFRKEGNKQEAIKIKEQHPELQLYTKFNQYAKQFSEIEKKVDIIIKNTELNDKEKRGKIKELELKKIEMAQKANLLLK